jgi:hypothetical protein
MAFDAAGFSDLGPGQRVLMGRALDPDAVRTSFFSPMDLTPYGYDASLEKGMPDAEMLPGIHERGDPGLKLTSGADVACPAGRGELHP